MPSRRNQPAEQTPLARQASQGVSGGGPDTDEMVAERSRRARKDPDDGTCLCGCGLTPSTPGARFVTGHDSKLRSMAVQVEEGELKPTDIPKRGREYLWPDGNYPTREEVGDESRPSRSRRR